MHFFKMDSVSSNSAVENLERSVRKLTQQIKNEKARGDALSNEVDSLREHLAAALNELKEKNEFIKSVSKDSTTLQASIAVLYFRIISLIYLQKTSLNNRS